MFLLVVTAPLQLEGVRIHHRPGVECGVLILDRLDDALQMRPDIVRLLWEVAEVSGTTDTVMEDWCLKLDTWLDLWEARWNEEGEIEDTAIKIGHGFAEECQVPAEWI